MNNKLAWNGGGLPPSWLRFLIIIILGFGLVFRAVNIDRKIYWHDETATSLRIAGYSKAEFVQQVFNGRLISVEEMQQKYQSLNSGKTFNDTFKALESRPEHSPLYYVIARFWAQVFGSSVTAMRSLPALTSLVAFPAIYWLCLELFNASLVGWIAVALISVSPIHILYAQEAREYSLWIVTILLSSAALLRAIRVKTNLSWGIYASTVALGIYSHLFFALVALGHGIYVLITESFKLSRTAIAYLLASLAGFVTFSPWLWLIVTYFLNSSNRNRVATGVNTTMPLDLLIDKWFRNVNRIFHDANLGSANFILVILAIYALYFVCRHTPKRVWLFILMLFGVTALTLGLPDVVFGQQLSTRTRYLMPCYLGIQLAVAYLFAAQITTSLKFWKQRTWQIITILVISMGVTSGVVSSQATIWWNKNISVTRHFPKIAQIINTAEKPLVISDGSETSILSLSYLLHPDVKLQLMRQPNILNELKDYSEVFLFDASDSLINKLQQETSYKVELISGKKKARLWKLA